MKTTIKALLPILLAFISLATFLRLTAAQESVPVCFWSSQGIACVERQYRLGAAGTEAERLLTTLLEGPTDAEQAQGIWSAIPAGTALDKIDAGETVTVSLRISPDALQALDHTTFEVIVEQIGWTLEPLAWRHLRIQVWDPAAGEFVPLSTFLPQIPAPRKEADLTEEEPETALTYTGQPPAPGQGQPQGSLSGKTVYISAGHGWEWEYDGRCACALSIRALSRITTTARR